MASVGLAQAQRIVLLLSGTVKGVNLYPEAHPAILNPIRELGTLLNSLLAGQPDLRLGVIDGVLFVEQQLFFTPSAAIEELTNILLGKRIAVLLFKDGLSPDELRRFIELVAQRSLEGEHLVAALATAAIGHIAVELADRSSDEPTTEEDGSSVQATYRRAVTVVSNLFKDVESGRVPQLDALTEVVDRVAALAIKDPLTLVGLAMIKDYDNYTFYHSVNVGVLAMALGVAAGLDKDDLRSVGMAGFLHDVGKTRIEKTILNKPGRLSSDEYERIKMHAEDGARIIGEMMGNNHRVVQAVLGHHIRFNRTGYPAWARNLPFDLFCEIVAVADCYDAITTLRVYKSPLNPKAALEKLRELSGTHLNSELVEKFAAMMGKYPVGTLVRLDSNEIAVVYRPDPLAGEQPTVRVVMDAAGGRLSPPVLRDLAAETVSAGRTIVAVVDPLTKALDVSDYLD